MGRNEKTLVLRIELERPLFVSVALLAVSSTPLFVLAPTNPIYTWAIYATFGLVVLVVAISFAWLFNSLKLTQEGFNERSGLYRVFTRWSDVREFEEFNIRIIGVRHQGVGVIYAKPRKLGPLIRLHKYDRVIFAKYGGIKARELAQLLNRWRDQNSNDRDGR